MATKIIHVLKSDKADDIIAEFQNTSAQEVIFILPAKAKFGQKESHFHILSQEQIKSGKMITIMSSSEEMKELAEKYGLQFIMSPKNASLARAVHSNVHVMPEPEEEVERLDMEDGPKSKEEGQNEIQEEEPTEKQDSDDGAMAIPVSAQLISSRRPLTDIVAPIDKKPVTIKKDVESEAAVPVSAVPDTDEVEHEWLDKFKKEIATEDEYPDAVKIVKSKTRAGSRRGLLAFAGISFIALMLAVYSSFGNAKVSITPRSENLEFKFKVTASSKNSIVDPIFNSIPGEFFSVSNTQTKTIAASGQKEVSQKAKGIITVSNKSGASQTLVATTRFESAGGLIYRIPNKVTFPPGDNDLEVIADAPGEKYNIESSTFTIPGFKGSPKYAQFSAVSKTKMSGGIVGLASVVADDDLQKAQEELRARAIEKVSEDIKAKSSGLIVLDSLAPYIEEEKTDRRAGEAADTANLSTTAKSSMVAFREEDIISLINAFIGKTGDLEIIKDSLRMEYKNPQINPKEESLAFDIDVKLRAGQKINSESVKEKLAGLNESQIKDAVNSLSNIDSARIMLSPFWVKKVPEDLNKISVKIEY